MTAKADSTAAAGGEEESPPASPGGCSVCDLYRRRWDIEVFFKQVKQSLKLSGFFGHSANAVRWQVYAALLVCKRGLHAVGDFVTAARNAGSRCGGGILFTAGANRLGRRQMANAAEGIPRGNIQGGRGPALPGGSRTGCSIRVRSHSLHASLAYGIRRSPRSRLPAFPAHFTWTRRRAASVISPSGCFRGAERRFAGGREFPGGAGRRDDFQAMQYHFV